MIYRLPPKLIFEIGKTVIDSDNELDMKENKNIIVTPSFCHQVKVTLWSFPGVLVLALVPTWSTQFGFGPSLEYLLW